jgi:hypothetical protein
MSLHHVTDIASSAPTLLEALMLLCFGVAWPVANLRMLRVRRAEGKGLGFTLMILCGYLAGASAKLVTAAHGVDLAPVFWLYLLNVGSVAVNLALQWHFGRQGVGRRLSTVSMVL